LAGATKTLEHLLVGDGAAFLDVGAGQGQALSVGRARAEQAEAERGPYGQSSGGSFHVRFHGISSQSI
jgi:hypothetical protein